MADAVQHDLTELALNTPVGDLLRKSPLVCLPETPLKQAFEAMEAEKAGSMLVADQTGRLLGILTRYDLITRIILPDLSLLTPIEQVMSRDIKTIDARSGALEAMLMMARYQVRHLPVLHEGFTVGLVSERDLFAHQRSSLRILSSSIEQAEALPDLKVCAQEVLALARRLLGQGVGATALARLVSHLNDALTRRVIHITERDLESTLGPLPRWTWLALGSEGREEQTVATDQDNAIIFQGDGPSLRPAFQRLAAAINQGLAEIGFPLCKGGVMAMNEKWCRSADEWRSTLGSWFSLPNPQALLDANIFLDFRGLYGALDLAQDLRAWVSAQVAGHRLFLRSLAQDAMRDEVGRLSRNLLAVSLARSLRRKGFKMDWLSPSCFDMKRDGTAPVVYFSRVLSLAYGLSETATDGRFSGLVAASAMSQSEAQQMREAFNVLQKYRLRAQLRYVLLDPSASQKMGSPNRLVLDELSTHEIEQLSEALAHLGRLKARLEMDFLR